MWCHKGQEVYEGGDHTEESPWSRDLGIPCQVWGGRNGSLRGEHSQ